MNLKLVRAGRILASKQFATVRAGERLLVLLIPARVAKGRATLQFTLKDAAGNTRQAKRTVTIAARS